MVIKVRTEINRVQKVLLLIIGVLAILLAAVLLYKGYRLISDKKQEREWALRHEEVQAQLDDVRVQIEELSGDTQALQAFLEEYADYEVIVLEESHREKNDAILVPEPEAAKEADIVETPEEGGNQPQGVYEQGSAILVEPEAAKEADIVETPEESGNQPQGVYAQGSAILVPEPEAAEQPDIIEVPEESENTAPEVNTVPEERENTAPEANEVQEVISGSVVAEGEERGRVPEETISDNQVLMPEPVASISGNAVVNGQVIPFVPEERVLTLEEKRSIRSSFEETQRINQEDKTIISENPYDFSDMKIACLGDSITEGSNLDNMENYRQYSYPSVLKDTLQAEEVCNLGIGGSSYGRYWDQAFVDRYKEIPQDTELILVMGGTNDGFAASEKELGTLEERAPRTFYGDVDELMQGLKADYPQAKIIFITPLPNVLHDYLKSQRDYLLPQSRFADAVKELAALHQIDVIDLYNSNILDTHDAQIISNYMPDGVHCNPDGYQILAEHIAGGIIRVLEEDERQKNTVSGNTLPGIFTENMQGVSSNAGQEPVSGSEGDGSGNLRVTEPIVITMPEEVPEELNAEGIGQEMSEELDAEGIEQEMSEELNAESKEQEMLQKGKDAERLNKQNRRVAKEAIVIQ